MIYRPRVDDRCILDHAQILELQHHVFALRRGQQQVVIHYQINRLRRGNRLLLVLWYNASGTPDGNDNDA